MGYPERAHDAVRVHQQVARSAAQEHFIDLCRLLGEPTPAEADPTGEAYCFERGAQEDTGGDGWADVWKRHHFAWEYRGKHADLNAAFGQLRQYALALENPPLLIVSDMQRFSIRTKLESRRQLYVSRMFATHAGRVPATADLACYWFEKTGRGSRRRVGKTSRIDVAGNTK